MTNHEKQLASLAEAKKGGITSISMMSALIMLAKSKGGIRLKKLALSIGSSGAAITGLSDRMEALGIAKRSIDATDRRTVILEITKKGEKLVERICQ